MEQCPNPECRVKRRLFEVRAWYNILTGKLKSWEYHCPNCGVYFTLRAWWKEKELSQPPHSKLWGMKEPSPTRAEGETEMTALKTLIKQWEAELADPYGEHYPYTDNMVKATIFYLKGLAKLKERDVGEASPHSEPLSSPQQAEGYPAEGK